MQVINTNVASLNAQRNLSTSGSQLATSLQRLSSGLRINSARDDAAGLAISERFSTQIRGLNVATRNANDGISLAQTAEGALAEIGNNLQRIRELAVQAVNATNNSSDRAALDAEVQQLKSEIDRVATQTEFNGARLLDGSFRGQAFQVGSNAGQLISIDSIASARVAELGTWQIPGASTRSTMALGNLDNGLGGSVGASLNVTFTSGSDSFSIQGLPRVPGASDVSESSLAASFAAAGFNGTTGAGEVAGFSLDLGGQPDIEWALIVGTLRVERADGAAFTRSQSVVGSWTFTPGGFSGPATSTPPSTTATGFANINLLDPDAATEAIVAMDAALDAVNSQRADLGAIQNRFGSVIQNLQTSSENLSASRSRIRDADYAKETAELTRTQILQQAGTAMLAQANQLPQNVLSLLR